MASSSRELSSFSSSSTLFEDPNPLIGISPEQRWQEKSSSYNRWKVIKLVGLNALGHLACGAVIAYGAVMYSRHGDKYADCRIFRGGCGGDPKCMEQEAEGICDSQGGALTSLIFGSLFEVATCVGGYFTFRHLKSMFDKNIPENVCKVKECFLSSKNPREFEHIFFDALKNGIFPSVRVKAYSDFLSRYDELVERKEALEVAERRAPAPYMKTDQEKIEQDKTKLKEDEEAFAKEWERFKYEIADEFPEPYYQA